MQPITGRPSKPQKNPPFCWGVVGCRPENPPHGTPTVTPSFEEWMHRIDSKQSNQPSYRETPFNRYHSVRHMDHFGYHSSVYLKEIKYFTKTGTSLWILLDNWAISFGRVPAWNSVLINSQGFNVSIWLPTVWSSTLWSFSWTFIVLNHKKEECLAIAFSISRGFPLLFTAEFIAIDSPLCLSMKLKISCSHCLVYPSSFLLLSLLVIWSKIGYPFYPNFTLT